MSAVPSRDLGQRLANNPILSSRDVVPSQAALEVVSVFNAAAATVGEASAGSPPPDVRALHALTALAVLQRAPDPLLSSRLAAWCEELAGCRADGMLMNSPDERGRPHLWGMSRRRR